MRVTGSNGLASYRLTGNWRPGQVERALLDSRNGHAAAWSDSTYYTALDAEAQEILDLANATRRLLEGGT